MWLDRIDCSSWHLIFEREKRMKKVIDARGKQCPLPVIETKRALTEMTEGTVLVLVDNEIAVQNLTKMAKQMKLQCSSEKIAEDHYIVTIELSGEGLQPVNSIQSSNSSEQRDVPTTEPITPEYREEATIVVLSADHMGEGNEELGKVLMKGFIYALTELDKLPQKILLYNSGAKLSVEGSDSLEDLKFLEEKSVEILTCGTCLNFYEISDKLSVGSVTNMYAIAEIMMEASKIIKP